MNPNLPHILNDASLPVTLKAIITELWSAEWAEPGQDRISVPKCSWGSSLPRASVATALAVSESKSDEIGQYVFSGRAQPEHYVPAFMTEERLRWWARHADKHLAAITYFSKYEEAPPQPLEGEVLYLSLDSDNSVRFITAVIALSEVCSRSRFSRLEIESAGLNYSDDAHYLREAEFWIQCRVLLEQPFVGVSDELIVAIESVAVHG